MAVADIYSVVALCVGHRPTARPGSTRRTSSQAVDWWEPLPTSFDMSPELLDCPPVSGIHLGPALWVALPSSHCLGTHRYLLLATMTLKLVYSRKSRI